jgi:hypothetical protein
VNHLPTIVSGIQQSDHFKDFQQNLNNLSADIKDAETLLNAKSKEVDKQEEKAKKAFEEHADQLIASYIQQHQDVIDDFDKTVEETIARLKKEKLELDEELSEKEINFKNKITKAEIDMKEEVVSTNTNFKLLKSKHFNLVENLKALTVDLEQSQKLGQNCKLFIKLKFTEQLCENIRENNEQIQQAYIDRFKCKTYNIQPTELSLGSDTRFFTFERLSTVERRVVFNFDINCNIGIISSLVALSETTLLILDYRKCRQVIYKLGTSQAICIDYITFETNPFDITKVSDYKVAVTFPNERMIRLITFSEDIKVIDFTDIQGNDIYTGIAYNNNCLIVSCWGPASVKILSMLGEIVKTFDKSDNGQNLFIEPWYLTVSPDNTMIYISDWDKHTVTCLTFDGKVKAIYKDDQLKTPQQIVVDEYGSVYVCGFNSYNIHQLTSGLTKVKILVDQNDRLQQPRSVAYCPNTMRLFVGMPNNIKVFNVSIE